LRRTQDGPHLCEEAAAEDDDRGDGVSLEDLMDDDQLINHLASSALPGGVKGARFKCTIKLCRGEGKDSVLGQGEAGRQRQRFCIAAYQSICVHSGHELGLTIIFVLFQSSAKM